MNVHHLELFYYVAKHGGISPAVRNIPYGIQQPAVSGQILALEEALHARLFQRRPFALTPAGRRLAEFITPFFENLGEVAAELRGESGQRLRLAASAQALRDHVPDLLKTLHQQHPLSRLCLQEAYQAEAETLLARQEIDLAITELADRPAAGIKAQTLLRLPLVLLVRADSPLRSARDLWGEETIRQPLVALGENQTLTRQFHEELRRRQNRQWPVAIEASSMDLVETYVAEGFGVGLSVQVPPASAARSRGCVADGAAARLRAAGRRRALAGQAAAAAGGVSRIGQKTRRRDGPQGLRSLFVRAVSAVSCRWTGI